MRENNNTPLLKARHRPAQHGTFPLLQLPLDILAMHLPTHLPYTSIIALRLSNRDLYTAVTAPPRRKLSSLDDCEKTAVLTATDEAEERSTRRCCMICGSWYPTAMFVWGPKEDSKEGKNYGVEGYRDGESQMIEHRVCRWHCARLERTISRHELTECQEEDGWTVEEVCMHCGGVLAWGRCSCKTCCQICWKRNVWCYTRCKDI
jgi:hypothetical protein